MVFGPVVGTQNMNFISVTLATFHFGISPLNGVHREICTSKNNTRALTHCYAQAEATKEIDKKLEPIMSALERNIPDTGFITGGDRPSVADLTIFDLFTSPFPGLVAIGVDLIPYEKVSLVSRGHYMTHMNIVCVSNPLPLMSIVRGACEEGWRIPFSQGLCQATWILESNNVELFCYEYT